MKLCKSSINAQNFPDIRGLAGIFYLSIWSWKSSRHNNSERYRFNFPSGFFRKVMHHIYNTLEYFSWSFLCGDLVSVMSFV